MSVEFVDELQAKIETAKQWPPPEERDLHDQLDEWAAFYDHDDATLKALHPGGWGEGSSTPHPVDPLRRVNTDRLYVADPLAGKMADGLANFIVGDDPKFTAGHDEIEPAADPASGTTDPDTDPEDPTHGDQERLAALVEANELPSQLQDATARLMIAEGEAWWRVKADRDQSDYATIEFHSRRLVYPLFRGRRVVACAFVTDLGGEGTVLWRYVEIHSDDVQRNLLYKVETSKRGVNPNETWEPRPLTDHPETADLEEEWRHGLPMLAGRIVNRRGRDPKAGVSQFQRVRGLLYALNESTTIGTENARYTLKRRFIAPLSSARPDPATGMPTVDLGSDVILVDDEDMGDGKNATPVRAIEYSFDADALVTYDGHLTDKILTRADVAPQLAGRHTEQAQSGASLKARLLDTILSSIGKARALDDAAPKFTSLAIRVDALPIEQGGMGRQWANPLAVPAIERSSPLPEDPTEEAARHVGLVGAMIEAAETAMEGLHPDWPQERRREELDRIARERGVSLPPAGLPAAIRVERPAVPLPTANGAGA